MKHIWIATAFVLAGCHNVVRDETTYRTEVGFMEVATMQEADSLTFLIKAQCKCDGGKFVVPECEKAAKRALVVQSRVPWHKALMLYNARLTDERPPQEPPAIPATSSLCPQ